MLDARRPDNTEFGYDDSEGVVNVRKYTPTKPSNSASTTLSQHQPPPKISSRVELEHFPDEPSKTEISSAQNHTEIEQELNAQIADIISTVKEAIGARTAAFYWASASRKRFIYAAHATDEKRFTTEVKLDYDDRDIMSEVVRKRNPVLYSEITTEDEPMFIRYYTELTGTKAFAGVPVVMKNSVCGVIIADSDKIEAFEPKHIRVLLRFAKICAASIDTHATKYSNLESLRFIEPSIQLMRKLHKEQSLDSIIEYFCISIKQALDFDHLSLALLNAKSEFVVKKTVSKARYVPEGAVIDLETSAVGISLMNGEEGTIDDLSQLAVTSRFFSGDMELPMNGSMLILPIRIGEMCSGAVVLEVGEKNYFNQDNFSKARFFVQSLAFSLQTILLRDRLKHATPQDEETGALTQSAFHRILRLEVNRCKRNESKITFVMLQFDDAEGLERRYGGKGLLSLMKSTMRLLENNVRNYDSVGRLGPLRFGICLYGMSAHNGRFWCEKIREQILDETFRTEDEYKTILATPSIGLSSYEFDIRSKDTGEDLASMIFSGAERALELAVKSGGNVVKAF
ncbi:MAG: diguanylate cyclase [Chloroherpetonaceae bacterium]|nr:diguanylate cyclase [Chloroherpetonaceae bacterium]